MTRKRQRMIFVVSGLAALGAAAALVLFALSDNITFFRSPTEVAAGDVPPNNRPFRISGLVAEGSVQRKSADTIEFTVTDTVNVVHVTYTGLVPNLFKEGQGVVAEGKLDASGKFVASQVLAKHDETYMPKEVVDALKEIGRAHV